MHTENGGDVGVAERREQLGLPFEAGESMRIAGDGIGKDLGPASIVIESSAPRVTRAPRGPNRG
jgi:hypothetical protein